MNSLYPMKVRKGHRPRVTVDLLAGAFSVGLQQTCRLIVLTSASEVIRPGIVSTLSPHCSLESYVPPSYSGVYESGGGTESHIRDCLQPTCGPPILMWTRLGGERQEEAAQVILTPG